MSSTVANGISAIARGSAFVFTCRVTGAAFTLLLQVILARWLGAAELGIYVLAFSWCVLLANFSHVGLAYSTVRVVGHALGNDRPGLIWGYLRRMSQIVIVTSIVFAAVGIVFVMLVKEPAGGERMTYLLAMAIVPLFAYINIRCPIAVAFRWISLAFFWTEVVRPIAICILVAGIWYFSGALNAATVMAVQLAMMLGVAIVLSVNVRQRLSRELPHTKPQYETRNWMRLALPLMIIGMYGNYFPEFMLILIGVQVPSDQVAIFNASYRLALIVTFLLTAVDAVTSPVTARLYAENNIEELQRVVSRAALLGFASSVAAVVGFAVLGRMLLGLFGPEFLAGYTTMMILVLAQLVRASAGPVISLLSVTGHQDRCLAVFGAALLVSVVLVFILVPIYGTPGAAMAVLLVTLGWSIALHRLVEIHIGVRPSIFGLLTRAQG
jgi:O-antigen/teichoic acid export membrane protein